MSIRKDKKRLVLISMLAFLAVSLAANAASSRAADIGLRMGYYFNAEAISLGMEMLTPVGDSVQGEWYFNPNFELAMGDRRDVAAFNADFHYDFDTASNAAVWVGAGPALLIVDRDTRFADDTEIDPALDLIFGVGAKRGAYRPFIQGKGVLSDHSEAVLSVGIRF